MSGDEDLSYLQDSMCCDHSGKCLLSSPNITTQKFHFYIHNQKNKKIKYKTKIKYPHKKLQIWCVQNYSKITRRTKQSNCISIKRNGGGTSISGRMLTQHVCGSISRINGGGGGVHKHKGMRHYYIAMDKSWKHYAHWKKLDTKGHLLHSSIYLNRTKQKDTY